MLPLNCIVFICHLPFLSFWVFFSFSVPSSNSAREDLWLTQALDVWPHSRPTSQGPREPSGGFLLIKCWFLTQPIVAKVESDLTLPNAPISQAPFSLLFDALPLLAFFRMSEGPVPLLTACACPAPLPGKLFSPALPIGCLLCIFTSWLDVPASGQCSCPSTYLRSLWAENPVLFLFNSYLYGYLCNILVLCWAVASMSAGTILLTLSDTCFENRHSLFYQVPSLQAPL